MAIQPADISAILNAFGQLGQANAAERQRDLQAQAERRSALGALGGLAGGIGVGLATEGNPYAAMAGSAAGSALLSGGRAPGAQTISQAGQAFSMAQQQQAYQQQQQDRSAITQAGAYLNPRATPSSGSIDTMEFQKPQPNLKGAMGEMLKAGQIGPALELMKMQQAQDIRAQNAGLFAQFLGNVGGGGAAGPASQGTPSPASVALQGGSPMGAAAAEASAPVPAQATGQGGQGATAPAAPQTGTASPASPGIVATPQQRLLAAATMFAINQGDADTAIKYLDMGQKNQQNQQAHMDSLERDMRAQYKTFVDEFQIARQAVQSGVNAPDNSTGDTGLIYDVATMYNGKRLSDADYQAWLRTDAPGMVQNFAAWLAGGHRLNSTQRQQLQELLVSEYRAKQETFGAATDFYGALADRKGIDRRNVLISSPSPKPEDLTGMVQARQQTRAQALEPDHKGAVAAIKQVTAPEHRMVLTPQQEASLTEADINAMTPTQRKAYKEFLSRKIQ